MCHEYRRIKGEEELSGLSLGDSSSSSSILSPGLSLLGGRVSIQTEYVFICTFSALSRLTLEGSDTPN